jgi:hypothetical protein
MDECRAGGEGDCEKKGDHGGVLTCTAGEREDSFRLDPARRARGSSRIC